MTQLIRRATTRMAGSIHEARWKAPFFFFFFFFFFPELRGKPRGGIKHPLLEGENRFARPRRLSYGVSGVFRRMRCNSPRRYVPLIAERVKARGWARMRNCFVVVGSSFVAVRRSFESACRVIHSRRWSGLAGIRLSLPPAVEPAVALGHKRLDTLPAQTPPYLGRDQDFGFDAWRGQRARRRAASEVSPWCGAASPTTIAIPVFRAVGLQSPMRQPFRTCACRVLIRMSSSTQPRRRSCSRERLDTKSSTTTRRRCPITYDGSLGGVRADHGLIITRLTSTAQPGGGPSPPRRRLLLETSKTALGLAA